MNAPIRERITLIQSRPLSTRASRSPISIGGLLGGSPPFSTSAAAASVDRDVSSSRLRRDSKSTFAIVLDFLNNSGNQPCSHPILLNSVSSSVYKIRFIIIPQGEYHRLRCRN